MAAPNTAIGTDRPIRKLPGSVKKLVTELDAATQEQEREHELNNTNLAKELTRKLKIEVQVEAK